MVLERVIKLTRAEIVALVEKEYKIKVKPISVTLCWKGFKANIK